MRDGRSMRASRIAVAFAPKPWTDEHSIRNVRVYQIQHDVPADDVCAQIETIAQYRRPLAVFCCCSVSLDRRIHAAAPHA